MSYIANIEGKAEYQSDEKLEKALEKLEEHGFESMVEVDKSSREIRVPIGVYRNLGRNLELLLDTASDGRFVGTSSEVNWHGFVSTPNTEDEYDLENWAAQNGFEEDRPEQADFETEDEWFEEYTEWQSEVGTAFMEEKSPFSY